MITWCHSKAGPIKLPSNHLIKAPCWHQPSSGPIFHLGTFHYNFKANLPFQRRKMQMTRFERKCITLCIMTGIFLESSNAQTELSVGTEGGLSALWELGMIFHYSTRMQTEGKYQNPESKETCLSPFSASLQTHFETGYILWTGKTKPDIDKWGTFIVWPRKWWKARRNWPVQRQGQEHHT